MIELYENFELGRGIRIILHKYAKYSSYFLRFLFSFYLNSFHLLIIITQKMYIGIRVQAIRFHLLKTWWKSGIFLKIKRNDNYWWNFWGFGVVMLVRWLVMWVQMPLLLLRYSGGSSRSTRGIGYTWVTPLIPRLGIACRMKIWLSTQFSLLSTHLLFFHGTIPRRRFHAVKHFFHRLDRVGLPPLFSRLEAVENAEAIEK